MNPAYATESLFNNVDDIGAGVAAIGGLMLSAGDEVPNDTTYGIGILLRKLGEEMRALNNQFLEQPYKDIRRLEVQQEQAAKSVLVRLSPEAEAHRQKIMGKLSAVLSEAGYMDEDENPDLPPKDKPTGGNVEETILARHDGR